MTNYYKRWCFTVNNYTDEDVKKICEFLTADNCQYAIVGEEIGEKEKVLYI